MNILLFVTCFLMMLSLITYAKIDAFRYFIATEAQFERYISSLQNSYSNKIAKQWYDTTIANKKAAVDAPVPPLPRGQMPQVPNQPPQGNTRASHRLNVRILIDSEMQAKNRQTYDLVNQWTKNLINNLYKKYPFFNEALQKRPRLVEELLEKMARVAEDLPVDKRPKTISELANLDMGPELEDVFYLMLKGCPLNDSKKKKEAKKTFAVKQEPLLNASVDENSEDENDIADIALNEPITEGYDSLLNYLTLQKTTKIRLYLASKEVLEAIFDNAELAQNAIERRLALYQAVLQGLPAEQASIQFKHEFQSYIKSSDDNLIDYRVTKTNPAYYN